MDERLAGAKWIKSSRSNGQAECVEVAFFEDGTAVRDSKSPESGVLMIGSEAWIIALRQVSR